MKLKVIVTDSEGTVVSSLEVESKSISQENSAQTLNIAESILYAASGAAWRLWRMDTVDDWWVVSKPTSRIPATPAPRGDEHELETERDDDERCPV